MYEFTIEANDYLEQDCRAFYHTTYVGMNKPGNPDYINHLKNTFANFPTAKLDNASQNLRNALTTDLPQILSRLELQHLTVCVIPRAKADRTYQACQMRFKSTVREVVNQMNGLIDGTDYIIRHTNTLTTHLKHYTDIPNDGEAPYPRITNDTCNISKDVANKDILLIDDLYTKSVNIDEDAIQALRNQGANSVYFYSIGCRM
ncbi:MAG: phosphoribosyltransferase [Tannerellaceae bacterium]|nr:phosphoribosyltransferase [Tannerellaceae bacterium]